MVAHSRSRPGDVRRTKAAAATLFAALTAAMLVPLPGPAARAQPAGAAAEDCRLAAWPLEAERAQLSAPGLRKVGSGERLALPLDGAVELDLVPQAAATLPHPPHAAGEGGSGGPAFAGVFALDVPDAGRVWQITLSASAWIDVLVEGRALDPVAFTGVRACPGVRKSLRFRMPQGQMTLQVSGAAGERLRLLAAPAQ